MSLGIKHARLEIVLIALVIVVLLSTTDHAQADSGRPTLEETLWGALKGGIIGLVIGIILIVAGIYSKRRKKSGESQNEHLSEKTPNEGRGKVSQIIYRKRDSS
jgi:uncharacterized membrane protein